MSSNRLAKIKPVSNDATLNVEASKKTELSSNIKGMKFMLRSQEQEQKQKLAAAEQRWTSEHHWHAEFNLDEIKSLIMSNTSRGKWNRLRIASGTSDNQASIAKVVSESSRLICARLICAEKGTLSQKAQQPSIKNEVKGDESKGKASGKRPRAETPLDNNDDEDVSEQDREQSSKRRKRTGN
ncbi:hypothetical protein GQ42DRAFT_161415 [Ramicandelaber brevisporus]|nr:hypothetical protein GQ42DRAFT_161415 [Ramicandelaber brevisporus]